MKKIIFFAIFLCSLNTYAQPTDQLTMEKLSGTYRVDSDLVKNTIVLDKEGNITLIEHSSELGLICIGKANLVESVVISQMKCENGKVFTQSIKLDGVTNLDNLTVPVYSSLFRANLPMHFSRIQP